METQGSPILKIMRFLEPNLDPNCVELLDISDAVDTIKKFSNSSKKSPEHFPILRIPSYSNDVLLGEQLHMVFILGNQTNIKFSEVILKVEVVPEHTNTFETCTIFENVVLEPNCKPLESHYTYLFKSVSQYRMTCSVEYSSHKGPLILKKIFMWNSINPVQLSHTAVKLPDGVHHLETQVKNTSTTLLVLKEVTLENRADNKVYLPFEKFSKDNIILLRPDETFSIIFPHIHGVNILSQVLDNNIPSNITLDHDANPHSAGSSSDQFYLNINWHSYTNISGTNVSKVDSFSCTSDLFYEVNLPKKVKINAPFKIEMALKNLTGRPVEVLVKFKNAKEFILQNNNVEKIHLKESKTVFLQFIPVCSGLHMLDSIELHCNNKCYNITNLQLLVTE